MEITIKTSINTPFLHIIKKNTGYYGICTESEIEAGSVANFKFDIENYKKPILLENERKDAFEASKSLYFKEMSEYREFCWKRSEAERNDPKNYIVNEQKKRDYINEQEREQRKIFRGYVFEGEVHPAILRKMTDFIVQNRDNKPDLAFEEKRKQFELLEEDYKNYCMQIERENTKILKNVEKNAEEELSIAVNKKFAEYMKENRYSAPREPRFCDRCNIMIEYANWSRHLTSLKHVHYKEYNEKKIARSTKVKCECGAMILPQNMKVHYKSDKHNGIGLEKVKCVCGTEFLPKFEKRHQSSTAHMLYMMHNK